MDGFPGLCPCRCSMRRGMGAYVHGLNPVLIAQWSHRRQSFRGKLRPNSLNRTPWTIMLQARGTCFQLLQEMCCISRSVREVLMGPVSDRPWTVPMTCSASVPAPDPRQAFLANPRIVHDIRCRDGEPTPAKLDGSCAKT